MVKLIVISTWFQVMWFIAVLGTYQWQWVLLALVAMTYAISWSSLPVFKLFAVVLTGLFLDTLNVHFGLLEFSTWHLPIWLVGLWLGFAWYAYALFPVIIKYSYTIVAPLAGLAGALSYLAGAKLGAAEINSQWLTLSVLFIEWCLITVFVLRLFSSEKSIIVESNSAKIMLALILVLPYSGSAQATQSGQPADKEWQSWPIVGKADFSWLFFDIYQARLLSPDGQYVQQDDIAPHPLALQIDYERNITKEDLLSATKKQWLKLGYTPAEITPWLRSLQEIFPNISDKERLTYVTDGNTGRFYYLPLGEQEQFIGQVASSQLNDAFLSIWLSPKGEYPRLRAKLVGENK